MHLFTLPLFILFAAFPARAHDAADWIRQAELRDPVTGEYCCGKHDCYQLPDGAVIPKGDGYYVGPTGETIPGDRVQRNSPNEHWWMCRKWTGPNRNEPKVRCLHAPSVAPVSRLSPNPKLPPGISSTWAVPKPSNRL